TRFSWGFYSYLFENELFCSVIGKKTTEKSLAEAISISGSNNEHFERDLHSLYVADDTIQNKEKLARAVANIYSDCYANADALELCRKTIANHDDPVYLYVFDHFYHSLILSWMMPIKDATHTCELIYLFKMYSLTGDDAIVMDEFTTAFTNFAKFGNPNGRDDNKSELATEWIPVDKTNSSRNFVFSAESHMKEDFFEGRPAKYIKMRNQYLQGPQ
ncbi:hypothetical protein PMAYCL1PPCAC_22941, partial [Pristionchus mayeri]